jgi:hypothetical protein
MTSSVGIVTGASQGIGRSTAVRLARDSKSVRPSFGLSLRHAPRWVLRT